MHREHLSKAVPTIAIHIFFKHYEKPAPAEGFDSIHYIDFKADTFQNAKDQECYMNTM